MVTPNFSAITPNVSPASTTYFCPVVGAADAGAADGGAVLAGGGAEGGVFDGAADAEALGLAEAEADGATLGEAERTGLAVPRTPVGVTVAESREQAPRSSAPPSMLATRPRRKR